jgi:hypothetical protein
MGQSLSLIFTNDKALKESKKRKHTEFGVLSRGVDSTDIFSNSFAKNLDVLNKLNMFLTEF